MMTEVNVDKPVAYSGHANEMKAFGSEARLESRDPLR